MDRRSFLGTLSALGSSLLSKDLFPAERPAKKPNVLFIFSDMQRAFSMGCYGDTNARTPNLDTLASQGARLDTAMSNTPVCCPHRASLMSGQYAHHHGMMSNGVDFLPKVKCLAETFRENGYTTGYAGKWHLDYPKEGALSRRFGFPAAGEKYGDYSKTRDIRFGTEKAISFMNEQSPEKPWLFMLSWIPPHSPYKASPGYADHFKDAAIPANVPSGEPRSFAEDSLADYYGMIEEIDAACGKIFSALNTHDPENTIVVYTSDHGDMIGSHGYVHKRWPHDDSARVPFLIRYPRRIRPGTVIDAPFGTPDIYPTLAGFAGITTPAGVDGMDYSPYIADGTVPPRDHVYLEMHYAYVPWPGWRAIRTKSHLYARTKDKPWLLFDTRNDPLQMKNLIDDGAHAGLARSMDDRLRSIMNDTGDSWDLTARSGDTKKWAPGGAKQQNADLGYDWPGKAVAPGGKKKHSRTDDDSE